MERDCKKCIHHISGSCDAWECNMETLEDYRNKVIDEFCEKLCDKVSEWSERCTFPKGVTCDILTLDCVTDVVFEIAEEMKGGV